MEINPTMVLTVIKNNLVEKAVARVEKEFSESREARLRKLQVVVNSLGSLLDEKATKKNLVKATFMASQAVIDSGLQVNPTNPVSMLLKGGFMGVLDAIGTYSEANFDESDYAELVEGMNLTSATKHAMEYGATIGQLFLIQPELFV